MKNIPLISAALFVAFGTYFMACSPPNQTAKQAKADSVSNWANGKNFVFHAQNALPQRGNNWPLTSDYTLTVTPDSIVAYLPYFGRAYTAPIDPSNGGIKFTSKKYDYSTAAKKGAWQIVVKPQDLPPFQNTQSAQQLYINIGNSGYGSVQVVSYNREQITFNGYFASK